MHRDQQPRHDERLSFVTLIIGSVSSAAAAVVVHEVWRPGSIIGAAATPVLMALFAEALRRPTERVTARTWQIPAGQSPPAHPPASPYVPGETIRLHRSGRSWRLAMLTGLAAFVFGAAGLTVSELLLHRSVADAGAGTTLFDGRPQQRSATPTPASQPDRSDSQAARHNGGQQDTRDRRSGTSSSSRHGQPPAMTTPTTTPTPPPTTTPSSTPVQPTPGAANAQPTPAPASPAPQPPPSDSAPPPSTGSAAEPSASGDAATS